MNESSSTSELDRDPGTPVKQQLRQEVGFGCPIPNCGNPYLEWHHFDPPWREQHHHNPEGMIALCSQHHPKADAGNYTKEQLHRYKQEGKSRIAITKARFEWMRQELLVATGSGFAYQCSPILSIRNKPVIWTNRDDEGYLLLNLDIPTESDAPQIQMRDNFWTITGTPEDVISPPSGKELTVRQKNGDYLILEFRKIESPTQFQTRYHEEPWEGAGLRFPITVVEIALRSQIERIEFQPNRLKRSTTQIGGIVMKGFWSVGNGGGAIAIG